MPSSNDQLQLLRKNSRAKITLALRRHGSMSRNQLAESTRLTVACVGRVVNELISDGELVEVGNSVGHRGRPKSYYSINPKGGSVAGVLIGAGSIQIVVADRGGDIVAREAVAYKHHNGTHEEIADDIADAVRVCALRCGEKPDKLAGIGVAVAGTADPLLGVIKALMNRRGWEDVPIAKMLEDRLGTAVFVDNNARAAAMYAHWFDPSSCEGGAVYLYVGEGVGGAYIDHRGLLRGAHDAAGYFGHMTIDPGGPLCACGNRGCLETFASDVAFIRGIWPDVTKGASDLTFAERFQMVREGLDLALRGDLRAARALTDVTKYIGIGVANIIGSLDPRVVHIYGTMTDIAQQHVVDLIRGEAMQRVLPEARGVDIKALVNYEDFLMRGAIGLVLSRPYRALRDEMNEVSAASLSLRIGVR